MVKKCSTCKFGCRTSGIDICQYILIMGHRRGCDPENCVKYVKGKKLKAPGEDDDIAAYQKKMRETYEVNA